MSDTSPTLLNRFLALPRAIQWASLAAIGVVVFLMWDSWVGPMVNDLDRQAETISNDVRSIRAARDLADDLRKPELSNIVTAIGAVRPPRNPATGTSAFTKVVNELMKKHGITDQDFSLRTRGNLQKNALIGVLPPGKRAERLTGDLKFSAKPEVAVAILSALESSPDIEQVSSVRLTKDQNGKVKVAYTLEAWVASSEAAKSGSGSSL